MTGGFSVRPVGVVRSQLVSTKDAPMQGDEGAPDAWIEIDTACADALAGIAAGTEIIVLTWLHLARRDVLQVHPRDDTGRPLAGVFATRSQDRPNPIGLHRVQVLEIDLRLRLHVAPLEAVDGTPVIDIKPVLSAARDR
jgi:tRNA-Thr(GGU) m(6)t(6)A37 methyltransferase TsaA